MNFDFEALRTNGIKINYLYVCERKLWLFDRGVQMESNSDKVILGKLLGEYSYPREETKEVLIDNLIKIDIVAEQEIREVKYSDRLSYAHKMQLLYYLYYLKKLGIEKKGVINYPKMRKKETVELTPEAEREIEMALIKIKEVLNMEKPPSVIKKPYCTKCAYYEFCFG
ncbi:MAG: CRISPR-associated protein Cas4 [Candidatus Omnitrophica bacterium]|nr:CRISPR-associated protein Cas4 [Candidatus Omnitrophota bacterium]